MELHALGEILHEVVSSPYCQLYFVGLTAIPNKANLMQDAQILPCSALLPALHLSSRSSKALFSIETLANSTYHMLGRLCPG